MKSMALLVCLVTTAVGVFSRAPQNPVLVLSDAQKTFVKMKTLAGSWEGRVTTVRQTLISGNLAQRILRVRTGRSCSREICLYKRIRPS